MARPLAVFGFTLLLSLMTASFLGAAASLVLGGVLFLCFLLSLCIRKNPYKPYFLTVFCTFACGLFLFTLHSAARIAPVQALEGRTATIGGELAEPAVWDGERYTYRIRVNEVSDTASPQSFLVAVTSKEQMNARVSDRVEMEVTFYKNRSTADYATGYYIRARALGAAVVTESGAFSLYGHIMQLRQWMAQQILHMLPGDEGAVLAAMVLGDTSHLSQALKSAFSESGVYHLFAVSGLHVSLWSGAVFWLFRRLRLGLRPAAVLSAGVTLFYMALTGFSMSVLRAGIMMIVMLLGRAFLKTADSLNSLGLSVAVVCLLYPTAGFSVSLLLTVSACLAIITLGRSLCQKYAHTFDRFRHKKAMQRVWNSLLISASLLFFTLPIQLVFFGRVMPLSLLSNLVFIPLGTVTIVLGGLAAVTAWLPVLAVPFAFFAGLGAKSMVFLASALAEFPITSVGIGQPYLLFWLAGCMLLFGGAFLLRRDGSLTRLVSGLCAVLLLASTISYRVINRDLLTGYVLDVGNGCAVLLQYQKRFFLVGCGGSNTVNLVNSVLQRHSGRELELVILLNDSKAFSRSAGELLAQIPVKRLAAPFEMSLPTAAETQFLKTNATAIAFDSQLRVEYNYNENDSFVLLSFGAAKVLVSAGSGKTLPPQALSPDIQISNRVLPDGVQARLSLLSGEEEALQKASAYRTAGGDCTATGGAGNLSFKINQNGSYTVRRDADWQPLLRQN